jgi:uncharacterized protein YhdP
LVGATRAEPAAALPAGARRTGASLAAQLRAAVLVLGAALALCMVWLVAYQAAAARVPQHRAALEELIRRQTGLEIRFTALAVRWGWYGPEALFREVELGEPDARSPLLRAPRLIVGLDAWRTLRSGHLEARRITLEAPSIDLAGEGPRPSRTAARSAADLSRPDARSLERWSGGEIRLTGGTLRIVLPGRTDADTFGISRAELRRVGGQWSAEAQLVLPPRLGADAHVSLQMRAKPDLSEISSATFAFEGRRLEVAAWAELAAIGGHNGVPHSGSGDFQLNAAFEDGRLRSASGYVAAEALAWPATGTPDHPLAFDHLRSGWRLTRRGGAWRLSLDALELGMPGRNAGSGGAPVSVSTHAASTAHSVVVDFTPDGRELSGRAQDVPVAPLVSLAHWYIPRMAANGIAIEGEARELSFDWNAHRPPGARLTGSAELRGLEFSDDSGRLALAGVSGHASLNESSVVLTLRARAARFALREAPAALEGLGIDAHLTGTARPGGGWQLETQDLEVHRQGLTLRASGAIGSAADGLSPLIDTHVWMKDCDLSLLASALGPHALPALGPAAAALRSGRMDRAELNWRGRLDEIPWKVPAGGFAGSLVLRGAALRESESWPEASELSAQIEWRGAHFHAAIDHGRTEGFTLSDGLADWDARADRPAHLSGRLAGDVQQLITWLQSHPQAASWTPGLESLDLHGNTVLDLEVALPPVSAGLPRSVGPRVRAAAQLDGVQLRPVPGLPALEALRGTLAFTSGHLQRSTLTAHWLGGPATLSVAERRDHGLTVLAVSGRGVMDVREAVQIAAGPGKDEAVGGTAEWSATLMVVPDDAAGPRWQLHADSSLSGLTSRLPEPFAKSPTSALPLHLDWETSNDTAQLHLALGDRLAAVAALTRSADTWRIDRGAVRLGGGVPVLPVEPTLLFDGNAGRLDLAACLALWRQASQDAALPPLHAHLAVNELRAGSQRFPQATLTAESAGGGGALSLQSAGLSGHARWPAVIDSEHPALLHLARFNLAQPGDTQLAAELAAVLSPAAQVSVEELQWQGHPLGSLSAKLAMHGPELEASSLALSGAAGEGRGTAHCLEEGCNLSFTLDSDDAAAVLAAFGFAPELRARYAHLEGQLRWSPEVSSPLATLGGSLHMRLDEGAMAPTVDGMGMPFPLLSVPALLTGMHPGSGESPPPALRFARFTADYELLDGEARTSGLHFDGDAEILVRGRIGLASGDYDQQAWILRGEDRLPAALRHLSPSPRVAALWLSLRDLLGGDGAGRARAALHLRGQWSDPIVTPLE